MAAVEPGDYAADKPQRMRSPIGSLRPVLISGIDFPCLRVCLRVCVSFCYECEFACVVNICGPV